MTTIEFDSYSLQADGVYTTDTDVFSAPAVNINAEKLAEADGSVIVKTQLDPKVFKCEGYMQAATTAALDTLIDTFKTNLNKVSANFDIDYAGGTRRYIATPRNMIISRPKGLNSAGWSVEFYCASPVGYDTTTSTLLASTVVTSATSQLSITNDGSYIAQPLITVTLTSGTGLTTSKSISISNDTNLRGITVTRDWTAADVLEIDCLNQTVYVNNVSVEYTGQFPKWSSGAGGIGYLDDFTTRSVSVEATYTKRYL